MMKAGGMGGGWRTEDCEEETGVLEVNGGRRAMVFEFWMMNDA